MGGQTSLMPGSRHRSISSVEMLVLGCAVLVAVLLSVSIDRAPTGSEATNLLAAEHLLTHGDTRYQGGDLEYFDRLDLNHPATIEVSSRSQETRYAASPLYALLLALGLIVFRHAPFVAAVLINALLLAWTILSLQRIQANSGMGSRWLFSATLVFASVVFAQVFVIGPTLLACALLASAWLLALSPARQPGEPLPEVYDSPLTPSPWREWVRWTTVGGLLSLAGTIEPAYWLFLAGAAMLAPRYRRRTAILALLAGVALVAFATLAFPGLLSSWAGEVRPLALSGSSGRSALEVQRLGIEIAPLTAISLAVHWPVALFGRNLLYFFLGRNLGVLPYFFPLFALLAFWRGRRERLPLLLAAIAAVVVLVAIRPFNFAGAPATIGDRLFVPIYASLWFLPSVPFRRIWSVALWFVAGVFLYPLWLSPVSSVMPVHGHWTYPSYLAQRFLPFEETQSKIPSPSTRLGAVTLRVAQGSILRPSSPLVIKTLRNGRAELVLEARRRLGSLYLESSNTPPEALQVRGAQLRETMFRPDGRVVFHLGFEGKGYERPSAIGEAPIWVNCVSLVASGSAPRSYALALSTDATGSWSPFSMKSR